MDSAEVPAGQPKRLAHEERRAQVMDAALAVFSESGYAASMGDVGRRAGVTRTVLYHYFATKEDLFLAVADRLLTELLRALAQAMSPSDELVEKARLSFDALVTFSEDWPNAWNILLPRGDDADPEVVAMRQRVEEQLLAAMAGLLTADFAEADIELESIDGQVMAHVLLAGAVRGIQWYHDHPAVPEAEAVGAIFDALWLGGSGIADRMLDDPARQPAK